MKLSMRGCDALTGRFRLFSSQNGWLEREHTIVLEWSPKYELQTFGDYKPRAAAEDTNPASLSKASARHLKLGCGNAIHAIFSHQREK